MSFAILAILCVLFGVGFGYCVQRAGLCFAHGLGEIFIGRGKRITRLFLVIFIVTSVGFLLSGYLSPDLGLKPIGQVRGQGFYNVLSGMLFGAGIFINGGCILGTLRQIGEGNLTFLVTLLSFIPGMAFVVYVLDPALASNYAVQKLLLPDVLGVSAIWVTGALAVAALLWLLTHRRKRR